jgi:hypothetical protein
MIYLIAGILVVQLINLILNSLQMRRVNRMNAEITERQQKYTKDYLIKDAEWKAIQKAELEELKELVKGSKYLEGLINGIQEVNKNQEGK